MPETKLTRPTRWLVLSGIVSLGLAVACAVFTVAGVMLTFNRIANSATAPRPADLAEGISGAALPSIAVVPLAILGVVLIIAGLIVRQPVDQF